MIPKELLNYNGRQWRKVKSEKYGFIWESFYPESESAPCQRCGATGRHFSHCANRAAQSHEQRD
jgi:hypothetical protein